MRKSSYQVKSRTHTKQSNQIRKFHSRNTMLVCGRPYEYSYAARIMRELQSSERERERGGGGGVGAFDCIFYDIITVNNVNKFNVFWELVS